jgi:hypothetical protein
MNSPKKAKRRWPNSWLPKVMPANSPPYSGSRSWWKPFHPRRRRMGRRQVQVRVEAQVEAAVMNLKIADFRLKIDGAVPGMGHQPAGN